MTQRYNGPGLNQVSHNTGCSHLPALDATVNDLICMSGHPRLHRRCSGCCECTRANMSSVEEPLANESALLQTYIDVTSFGMSVELIVASHVHTVVTKQHQLQVMALKKAEDLLGRQHSKIQLGRYLARDSRVVFHTVAFVVADRRRVLVAIRVASPHFGSGLLCELFARLYRS
jgi:hypothetical protein